VQNIRESAAFDKGKMTPPKEWWFDDDLLAEWYESRKETEIKDV
jgi:hypothetical protein